MTTIKHQIGFVNMNSVDQVVNTLNSLEGVECTIEEKKITSAILSISLSNESTLEDVLALGSLIGTIQATRICGFGDNISTQEEIDEVNAHLQSLYGDK